MKLKTLTPLLVSLGVMLNGCVTSKEESTPAAQEADLEAHPGEAQAEVEPDEIDESIDHELTASANGDVPEIGSEEDEINKAIAAGLPVEINESVNRWIDYFSKKNGDAFQRFMDRGQPYKKLIVATLRDAGLPTELYYLAMIESGFVINAHSSASAVGFWQFIPATGRRYGLRVDKFVDERRDPMRSTVAASMYLGDLHNVFNSWYLAMAAYNAGEMRILNAIMRGKSRDFWELARQRVLPAETMDYIPKVLAAYIVAKDPEKYGLRRPTADAHEAFVGVTVPGPIALSSVADQTNIPLDRIQAFNPHLKTGVTPADAGNYKIWIPRRYESEFKDNASKLADHRMSVRAATPKVAAASEGSKNVASAKKVKKFHRVRRGENLTTIAQTYGISVEDLKDWNNLRSNRINRGQRLKVLADATSEKLKTSASAKTAQKDESVYRVRRGEGLTHIAKKFGMTVAQLKKMNNLRRNVVHVGQVLKVNKAG